MNYKLKLTFVSVVVLAMAVTGVYVNRDTGFNISDVPSPQQTQTEEVKVEDAPVEETKPVETPKVQQRVQAQTVAPIVEQPSICDLTYGPETSPGVCQMDLNTFRSLARTVAPESTDLYNIMLNANARIYKTADQSLYIPLCKLPLELKGDNPTIDGQYREQLRICAKMITKAFNEADPTYNTSWGQFVRGIN